MRIRRINIPDFALSPKWAPSSLPFPHFARAMALAFREKLLEEYTDSELTHHIISSPSCASTSGVFNLSLNLIAEHYEPSEVEDALKVTKAAGELGIRGPSIWKITNQEPKECLRYHGSGWGRELRWTSSGRNWAGSWYELLEKGRAPKIPCYLIDVNSTQFDIEIEARVLVNLHYSLYKVSPFLR